MYEYIFIFIVGGKPDDITVLLSIVAEYTDWLAWVSTPASPFIVPSSPLPRVLILLAGPRFFATDLNGQWCKPFACLFEILVENHYCHSTAHICQQHLKKIRSEDWPSHCPFHDGMDVFKAKMTITFWKRLKYWKWVILEKWIQNYSV